MKTMNPMKLLSFGRRKNSSSQSLKKGKGKCKLSDSATSSTASSDDSSLYRQEDTPRIALAKAYVAKWNEHDLAAAQEMVTDDYAILFQDGTEMPYSNFREEIQKIFNAFPDFKFEYRAMDERNDGVVVLHKMVPSGHHTGAAYGFGPCDPIEPSGKYVCNEPETIHYHFREEGGTLKVCKQQVFPHGEMTGRK